MEDRDTDRIMNKPASGGTTRREFLKAAGSLGMLAVAYPLVTNCSSHTTLEYPRTIREMTADIKRQMAKDGITGAAIALVDDQQNARLGKWIISNFDPDDINRTFPTFSEDALAMELSIRDGMLLKGDQPLSPVSDTLAYLPGLARDLGAAVKIVHMNGEEQIQYSGFLLRKA